MTHLRRPVARAALAALALVAGLVLVLRGGGDPSPATGSARLVPGGALAYLHFSTDREREAVHRAGDLLARFPAAAGVRDSLASRLIAIGPGLSYRRDVRPWLGSEAALALLDTPGKTATPLAVIAVGDRARAQAFLARASSPPEAAAYRGVRITTYGALSTAFVGRYLLAGPVVGVRAGIDANSGLTPSLQRSPGFRGATRDLPADRAADAYLSPAGVSRLLAAQPGLLGAAGSLLTQPGLTGTALSLAAADDGARLRVRSLIVARSPATPPPARPFEPRLVDDVPADALAYLGTAGLDRSAGRLLSGLAGTAAPGVAALLARAGTQARGSGLDLRRDLLALFRGEVAIWLKAASPAPVLTVMAATRDERRSRAALAALRAPLERALRPPRGASARAPVVGEQRIAGVRAFVLRLGPAARLVCSVFDGKLVVSTSPAGIEALRGSSGPLPDARMFETTLGDRPARVTSLAFADVSRALALAERTGLSGSPAYGSVRGDLRRVRAVGAATWSAKGAVTTDLFVAAGQPGGDGHALAVIMVLMVIVVVGAGFALSYVRRLKAGGGGRE